MKGAVLKSDVEHVRIHFRLERDADGYPPADVETLWAVALESGDFQIDSIPFFVRRISVGDVVAAEAIDGNHWYRETKRRSARSTVRIALFDAGKLAAVRAEVEALGCDTEFSEAHSLIAVDVPGPANYAVLRELLEKLLADGIADYEESALRE